MLWYCVTIHGLFCQVLHYCRAVTLLKPFVTYKAETAQLNIMIVNETFRNWSHKYSVDVLNPGSNRFCFIRSITDLWSILLLPLTKMLKRLWFPWLYLGAILSGSVCCLHGRGSIYSTLTCECIDPKTADWQCEWTHSSETTITQSEIESFVSYLLWHSSDMSEISYEM
jgi:hypothetical protein